MDDHVGRYVRSLVGEADGDPVPDSEPDGED
jgi:hypothetical protein